MKSIAKTHEKECICSNCYHARVRGGAAAEERARIRRLIGPALRKMESACRAFGGSFGCACDLCDVRRTVHAATRPESKRKKAKGTK